MGCLEFVRDFVMLLFSVRDISTLITYFLYQICRQIENNIVREYFVISY